MEDISGTDENDNHDADDEQEGNEQYAHGGNISVWVLQWPSRAGGGLQGELVDGWQ